MRMWALMMVDLQCVSSIEGARVHRQVVESSVASFRFPRGSDDRCLSTFRVSRDTHDTSSPDLKLVGPGWMTHVGPGGIGVAYK